MTAIQVGHDFLNLTIDVYTADKRGAIIDSGTTLAYLPQVIYESLVKKVLHNALATVTMINDTCYKRQSR